MTLDAFAMATLAGRTGTRSDAMRALDMAHLLSDALDHRADPGVWTMVHGAGLIWHNDRLHPLILGDANLIDFSGSDPVGMSDAPQLRDVMANILGGAASSAFKEVMVLGVAAGVRHAAPGDPIQATGSGQIGPLVQWGSGREGFITAGHVAQSATGPVNDGAGTRIGTVLWSNDPALSPSSAGDVDAALVEFVPGIPRNVVTRATIVPAGGSSIRVASSRRGANLLAACRRVQLGATNAHFADCYLTDQRITNPGDSGGLVECNGDIAGIVIGAFSRRDMTVIQAIGYQLSEIRARSGQMVTV